MYAVMEHSCMKTRVQTLRRLPISGNAAVERVRAADFEPGQVHRVTDGADTGLFFIFTIIGRTTRNARILRYTLCKKKKKRTKATAFRLFDVQFCFAKPTVFPVRSRSRRRVRPFSAFSVVFFTSTRSASSGGDQRSALSEYAQTEHTLNSFSTTRVSNPRGLQESGTLKSDEPNA